MCTSHVTFYFMSEGLKTDCFQVLVYYLFSLFSLILYQLWYKFLQFRFITLHKCFLDSLSVFSHHGGMYSSWKNLATDINQTSRYRVLWIQSPTLPLDHCAPSITYYWICCVMKNSQKLIFVLAFIWSWENCNYKRYLGNSFLLFFKVFEFIVMIN